MATAVLGLDLVLYIKTSLGSLKLYLPTRTCTLTAKVARREYAQIARDTGIPGFLARVPGVRIRIRRPKMNMTADASRHQ
jgi:hypothetical protein